MNIRYITIEREYGSGGIKIAQQTAKRCGISSYGREIMEAVAQKHHLAVSELERYEETMSSSFLYSLFVMSQSQTGDPDLLSQEAKLYVAESRVIKELAKEGPAIFVGHCACHALEDQPGVLRVFIRSNEAEKEKRIIRDYGIAPKDVSSVCRKFNRKRSNYYTFCTRKKWNDLNNYDIVLDSSALGIDGCAAALSAIFLEGRT